MFKPTINSHRHRPSSGAIGIFFEDVKDNKEKIIFGLIALASITIGTLAKFDKLGIKLPNGFSKDVAFGTSFAPLGLLALYLLYGKIKDKSAHKTALDLIEREAREKGEPLWIQMDYHGQTVIAKPDPTPGPTRDPTSD